MEQGRDGRTDERWRSRDEEFDLLAGLLDDVFRIPGTRVRFGLDAILGLIPGLGDAITGLGSLVIVYAAWRRGLPRVAMGRMLVNLGLDVIIGAVPFLGDVFDIAWKANRRNVAILRRHAAHPDGHAWRDRGFLLVIAAAVLAIIAVPLVLFVWLVRLWMAS